MPKIQRKTQKIFCNSADSDQIAVFGSMSTGNPVYSNDVEQLQSNEAYESGWDAATLEDKAPFMEEMNGVQYGLTYQLAYNFQEGIPEYDAETTYYIGSIVKVLEDNKPVLYTSLTDENLGNSLSDGTKWERLQLGGGAGQQLFDTILKDHVLTYEESKGLALQGTYVYKEALAGSRYGYPDFYNKCLEEYQNSTLTGTFNYEQPINPSGITSSGTWSNVSNAFDGSSSTYATVEDTTSYIEWDLGGNLYIEGFTATGLWASGLAQGINLSIYSVDSAGNETLLGTSTGLSNTSSPYTLTCNFNPVICNKIRFKSATTIDSSVPPRIAEINLIAKIPLYVNSNGHLFYDIANRDSIDEYFDKYGSAWFYGVDTANERIFLPRNNFFDQATGDISEVGQSVEAGLPNITGTWLVSGTDNSPTCSASGSVAVTFASGAGNGHNGNTSKALATFNLNASRSSAIYGNSNTVQPNAVKKLLYICVGNTTNYEGVTEVVNQGMEILEQVNEGLELKVNKSSMVEVPTIVESYVNGLSWYRIWSNGWCEQGGGQHQDSNGGHRSVAVTLLKPYIDENYSIFITSAFNQTTAEGTNYFYSMETDGFNAQICGYGFNWYACGYIA